MSAALTIINKYALKLILKLKTINLLDFICIKLLFFVEIKFLNTNFVYVCM